MNNLRIYFNAIGNVRSDGNQISLDIVDIINNQNDTAQNNKIVTLVTDLESMRHIVDYLNEELKNITEFLNKKKPPIIGGTKENLKHSVPEAVKTIKISG